MLEDVKVLCLIEWVVFVLFFWAALSPGGPGIHFVAEGELELLSSSISPHLSMLIGGQMPPLQA